MTYLVLLPMWQRARDCRLVPLRPHCLICKTTELTSYSIYRSLRNLTFSFQLFRESYSIKSKSEIVLKILCLMLPMLLTIITISKDHGSYKYLKYFLILICALSNSPESFFYNYNPGEVVWMFQHHIIHGSNMRLYLGRNKTHRFLNGQAR